MRTFPKNTHSSPPGRAGTANLCLLERIHTWEQRRWEGKQDGLEETVQRSIRRETGTGRKVSHHGETKHKPKKWGCRKSRNRRAKKEDSLLG